MSLPDNNPKTRMGVMKPGVSTVPPTAIMMLGAAMKHGAEKYGPFNYREESISMSVYYDAMWRHLMSWWDGEDFDTDSGLHHLAHVMAGAAIVMDTLELHMIEDDRPPSGSFARMVREFLEQSRAAPAAADPAPEPLEDDGFPDPDFEEWVESLEAAPAPAEDGDEPTAEQLEGFQRWIDSLDEVREAEEDSYQTVVIDNPHGDSLVIPILHDVSHQTLREVVKQFLNTDHGSKSLAEYNQMRLHIGDFHTEKYEQENRTRLVFLLHARMVGCTLSWRELDRILQQATGGN